MSIANDSRVCVYLGEGLARYAFPGGHPFGGGRMEAFWDEMMRNGLDGSVTVRAPVMAAQEVIERFPYPCACGARQGDVGA